jgi:ureidoacrylate peracid hydrolase
MDALVIVDLQNDFCHPQGALARRGIRVERMEAVVAAVDRLARAFRAAGRPVLFVRTEHGPWTDSPVWVGRVKHPECGIERVPVCLEGSWGAEFYGLRPEPGDRVIVKRRYSAFYGTDLELTLRALGVRSIVVVGVATNVCVETTVRDAFMRDFDTVVVPEGCAANTPEEHAFGLRSIETYFGRVVPLEEVLRQLEARVGAG